MLVVHYRHVTHSCVERASTCLASLNQHQRRCIFVADGLWAGPRSHPAELVAASSTLTPLAADFSALYMRHFPGDVEVSSLDDHGHDRNFSKDVFIHAVVDDVDGLEGSIEISL